MTWSHNTAEHITEWLKVEVLDLDLPELNSRIFQLAAQPTAVA